MPRDSFFKRALKRAGQVTIILGVVSSIVTIIAFATGTTKFADLFRKNGGGVPRVTYAPDPSWIASEEPSYTPGFLIADRKPNATVIHDDRRLDCYASLVPDLAGIVLCTHSLKYTSSAMSLTFIAAHSDDSSGDTVQGTLVMNETYFMDKIGAKRSAHFDPEHVRLEPGQHMFVDLVVAGLRPQEFKAPRTASFTWYTRATETSELHRVKIKIGPR